MPLAYDCMPAKASTLVQLIAGVDSARDYRINAAVYGVLEGGLWGPTETNWRNWFRQQFGLTFVVQVPPENSYFTLNLSLWTYIYGEIDNGHVPDQDFCWYLRFPDSQGGGWPVRWPA